MKKGKVNYTTTESDNLQMSEPLVSYVRSDDTDFSTDNVLHVISRINRGISYNEYAAVRDLSPYGDDMWANFLNLSTKTLERYAQNNTSFKILQSERILELKELFKYAMTYFESKKKMKLWLETPSYGLNTNRPLDLLTTAAGIEIVTGIIVGAEHGIFI